jgi:hypothetical protein
VNRRGFLKALGFGGLSAALGSILPAPVLRALRPIAAWARALVPGDVLHINVDAATSAPWVLLTLGFRRDDGQLGHIVAKIQSSDYGPQHCMVVIPYHAVLEAAKVTVSDLSSEVKLSLGVAEHGEGWAVPSRWMQLQP